MKIGLASDHRGYKLKEELISFLKDNYDVINYGTNSEESTDYPIYAFKLCKQIGKEIDFQDKMMIYIYTCIQYGTVFSTRTGLRDM